MKNKNNNNNNCNNCNILFNILIVANHVASDLVTGNSHTKWHSKTANRKNKADTNEIESEIVGLKIASKSTTKLQDKRSVVNNANNDVYLNDFSQFPRQHQQNYLRKKKSTNAINKDQQQQRAREGNDNNIAVEQNFVPKASGHDGMVLDGNAETVPAIDGAGSSDTSVQIDDKAKILEKKCRNVAKKLQDIQKLKARQEQGEILQLNQLQKIAVEPKLMEELRNLEKLS